MSKFAQYNTIMTDAKCLTKALGKRFKEVELHSTPQDLYDYTGRKTHYLNKDGDKAEIIINRKHVGSSANDIGFAKDSTGNFQAIISAFDSSKHDAKWLESLSKDYLREKAASIMSDNEGEFMGEETLADGSIRLQYKMPVYA